MDVGVFYTVLKDIHSEFDKKRQSVITDIDLSPDGKAKRLAKIDENRVKAVSQLQESFETAYNKELATLDKKLNVSKETHADKAREILKGELVKAVNFGELDKKYITLDDNSRTQLILSAIADTHKERMDFAKAQALSQGNESWYRAQLQKGLADNNIERLELLSKSLDLKADAVADKLKPEFDAVINKLRIDALTPEQRQALADRETLTRDKELLDYSFTNVSERNEYKDIRNVGKETPATTLTYAGGSDRVLGQAPIQRQFSQYKTNK